MGMLMPSTYKWAQTQTQKSYNPSHSCTFIISLHPTLSHSFALQMSTHQLKMLHANSLSASFDLSCVVGEGSCAFRFCPVIGLFLLQCALNLYMITLGPHSSYVVFYLILYVFMVELAT